ncbi:MAG: hypothetical protein ACF8NJ_04370 [Phycisphaerales bacterium JB038]
MAVNHPLHRHLTPLGCTLLLLGSALPGLGQETAPAASTAPMPATSASDWQWRVEPSFWLVASSGKLRAGRNGSERQLNQLNLDNPTAGVYLEAEARREDWRFSFDGFFFNDEGEARLRSSARLFDLNIPAGTQLDTSLEAWSLSAGVWRRVFRHQAGGGAEDRHSVDFDLFAGGGLRVLGAEASLDIAGGGSGRERDFFGQAFLGGRAELRLDDTFAFTAQADVGAGLPERQFSTLHLAAGAEWRCLDNAALRLGYQHLDLDIGGGDLSWDGRLAGLYAGFSITY